MATTSKQPRRVVVSDNRRRSTAMDNAIGIRIRARRLELHMSQDELAKKLGISFQQVQKYEKGTNRVGSSRLVNIAHILGVETAHFLTGLNGNGNEQTTEARFIDILATKDGVDILEAMMKLPTAHRREVIDLARVLVRAYGD